MLSGHGREEGISFHCLDDDKPHAVRREPGDNRVLELEVIEAARPRMAVHGPQGPALAPKLFRPLKLRPDLVHELHCSVGRALHPRQPLQNHVHEGDGGRLGHCN